jgi:2'-hydroxyisoflavone reductase
LIVGPYDVTDRFTYWPHRIAQGGDVLAPGPGEQPVQFIDARDLSEWIVRIVETRKTGVYNAKSSDYTLTMRHLLEECKVVSRSNAHFVWLSEEFLLQQDVAPYADLPLWVPSEMVGFARVNCRKAIAAGLTFRPLADTISDTLTWDATRPPDTELRAGLKREREEQLLQEWYKIAP